MIIKGGKELQARYYGKKEIQYIYKGLRLIWQAIKSCFGSGYWMSALPWKNDNGWKNK